MIPIADAAVYVYGVMSSSDCDPMSVHGIEGVTVQTVEHRGLVALTSRITGGRLAARDVRAHWRVLEQAFQNATVLPARFGTVMEDEDAVRARILDPNAEYLSDVLVKMTGLAQMTVKGRYDEDVLLREIVHSTPAIAALRERARSHSIPSEQLQLGRLVDAEVARCRLRDTEIALATLEPLAVAVLEEEASHPTAFHLSFLIERRAQDRFDAAVGRVRESLTGRLELRYVGPFPPLSFVEADVGSGSEAWA